MTLDEIRDELAINAGWDVDIVHLDGEAYQVWTDYKTGAQTNIQNHPIPATLEEASKLPEGWTWQRRAWGWIATHLSGSREHIKVPDTGSELYDRFSLRLQCERAEKGSR